MKRNLLGWAGALILLLSACGGTTAGTAAPPNGNTAVEEPAPTGGAEVINQAVWSATFRVVDGAEEGHLLLAENGGGAGAVYRMSTEGLELDGPILDGQLINVCYEAVMESYPARFAGVSRVEHAGTARDDRCGLYLQVLEDLWETDPGLNTGITELGVDLSGVTDLSEAEKSAVIHRFGEKHGLFPVTGTWEELCEWGYIDRENLIWEDGCLFTIEGTAETFEAEKWASGLGAFFFLDCTGDQSRDGTWTYEVGGTAIS